MYSRAEQQEIMRRDAERRLQRDIADHLALVGRSDELPTKNDVLPNRHRDIRVSRKWHQTQGRVVGVATGTEHTSDGTPTVLVKRPGQPDEIRTVASFRKGRSSTPRTNTPKRQTDIEKYQHIIGTNADVD